MDKYKNSLINSASKLDAVTDSCGEITKLATAIVEENSKESTIALLKKITAVIDNPGYVIEIKRMAQLLNTNLIEYYGYATLQNLFKHSSDISDDPRSLS